MASQAAGGEDVGELSEALRAKIEEEMGNSIADFNGWTDLGDAAAVFLAEKLRGDTVVEYLDVVRCGIGAVGARALAEALAEQNITLKELNLCQNDSLGDDGAEEMAQMLRKNATLEALFLGNCGVGERGALALGEALKENSTLTWLLLSGNYLLGEDGGHAIAGALRWNGSLTELDLEGCSLTDAAASSLLASLRESNSALTDLELIENDDMEDFEIEVSIQKLLEENKAVIPETAERRARCLLFCCLQLAPTAHEHVVPSIGAVPVPVMQYAVEHAGKLHVAKRFERVNVVAGESSARSLDGSREKGTCTGHIDWKQRALLAEDDIVRIRDHTTKMEAEAQHLRDRLANAAERAQSAEERADRAEAALRRALERLGSDPSTQSIN